jgi:hypothetical protein
VLRDHLPRRDPLLAYGCGDLGGGPADPAGHGRSLLVDVEVEVRVEVEAEVRVVVEMTAG